MTYNYIIKPALAVLNSCALTPVMLKRAWHGAGTGLPFSLSE